MSEAIVNSCPSECLISQLRALGEAHAKDGSAHLCPRLARIAMDLMSWTKDTANFYWKRAVPDCAEGVRGNKTPVVAQKIVGGAVTELYYATQHLTDEFLVEINSSEKARPLAA